MGWQTESLFKILFKPESWSVIFSMFISEVEWSWEVGSPAMSSEVWISWAGRHCLISPIGTNMSEMWLLNCATLQTGLRLLFPFALSSLDHHRNARRLWTDFSPPLFLPKWQTTFTSRDYRKKTTFNKKLPTMKIYFLGKFFLFRYKNACPWKYKPSSLKTVVGGI